MQNIKMQSSFTTLEKELFMDCTQTKCNKTEEDNEYCTQETQEIEIIRKSHKKCGEIYMTGIENFKFVCMLCEKTFFTCIEEFLSHVAHCQQKDGICAVEIDPLESQQNYDYSLVEQTSSNVIPKEEVDILYDSYEEIDSILTSEPDVGNSKSKRIPKVHKMGKLQEIFDQSKKYNSSLYQEKSFDIHKRFGLKQDSEGLLTDFQVGTNKDKSKKTRKVLDRYTCKYCEKCFTATCLRVQHERIHTGEKPFKCSVCSKAFRIAHTRKQHERSHKGIKPYKCGICNAAFLEKSNLNQHIQRHKGERKAKCGFCEKAFYTNTEKLIHERIHTGEKSFLCFECGQCFITASKLNTHMKRHTGVKPFKCDKCDKTFYYRKLLKAHYIVHTGEKPFTCRVCDAKFPRKKSLQSHLQIHSDVAQYSCTICGKSFKQGPGLYGHMKSHGKVLSKL